MFTNTYRLAERTIRISSQYDQVHRLCRDYVVNSTQTDFSVCTSQADIAFERNRSYREDNPDEGAVRSYSDAYLETLAVYRQIAERMPVYDTVLMHGSCVAVDGVGYLFTAKSGTGKSTHTRFWRELLGAKAQMINDDKPLIRIGEEGVLIFGTPWDGKHRLSTNCSVPLRAICLLTRGEHNEIQPISPIEAYPMLVQQIYRPLDEAALHQTMGLIDRLLGHVRFWRLRCRPDLQAAEVAWQAMKP